VVRDPGGLEIQLRGYPPAPAGLQGDLPKLFPKLVKDFSDRIEFVAQGVQLGF